ncbi:hypothetical protein [Brevibacillus fortis]|uniref:Uncharacterized protein n=1 Tax=Brevibacillus fortis TaxID=2126352 RepID=A0A2P7UVS6_9BACL|nr:hypothetical protein [Brevibacillus fortis]PSJ91098.1 hypothetical protein C7R93_20855 [Brevibacillus fortis]
MHGFPDIVFDRNNKIHLPLTVFAKEAHAATNQSTANTYLFESGGRVSEDIGLTLGDWYSKGLLREANGLARVAMVDV